MTDRLEGPAAWPAPSGALRRALAIVALLVPLSACGTSEVAGSVPSVQLIHLANAECLKLERLYPAPDGRACAGQRHQAMSRARRLIRQVRRLRREGRALSPRARERHVRQLEQMRFVADQLSARQYMRATGITRRDLGVLADWLYADGGR